MFNDEEMKKIEEMYEKCVLGDEHSHLKKYLEE